MSTFIDRFMRFDSVYTLIGAYLPFLTGIKRRR